MQDSRLSILLKLAQTINPQIQTDRSFHIDLDKLRQLPVGTLGYEVACFIDSNGFDPFDSGDWIQRTHDVWHVLTGLSPSVQDELRLQAFTRAQVFRPSSAILVLVGLLTRNCQLEDILRGLQHGKMASQLIDWDIESDWETPLTEVRQKLGIQPFNYE
jgi:ubiquinone biosynthesis protein COQ4